MRTLLGKLTYSNVMATIAVFIALGAGAYAAVNLPKNSVKSKHIKNSQVKKKDLRDAAVSALKLQGSVRPISFESDLPMGSLTDRVVDFAGFEIDARCENSGGEPELTGSITFPEDGTFDRFVGEDEDASGFSGGAPATTTSNPIPFSAGPTTPGDAVRLVGVGTYVGDTRSAVITLHLSADSSPNRCTLAGAILPATPAPPVAGP